MIKFMKQTSVKVRRKFDETFKREAVQNWLQSGKSAEVIAQELGFAAGLLYSWKKLLARWPTCKTNWTRPCARTAICASSATF